MLCYLQAYAVWQGLAKDVTEKIVDGADCEVNQPPPVVARLDIKTPNRPFGWVVVDFIIPLPLTMASDQYVLMAVCHLTGWAKMIPLPDKHASTVWVAMN